MSVTRSASLGSPPGSADRELYQAMASTSCERCRKRKIRCDRQSPCAKCRHAGADCIFPGARSKPAPRKYVQALENRISHLELLLRSAATANNAERDTILAGLTPSQQPGASGADNDQQTPQPQSARAVLEQPIVETPIDTIPTISDLLSVPSRPQPAPSTQPAQTQSPGSGQSPGNVSKSPAESGDLVIARAREGRMCKLTARKATRFYGGTSLYHMQLNNPPPRGHNVNQQSAASDIYLPHDPKGEVCRRLMALFFQNIYHYNMCIYREYFLRDYAAGGGPYYSDVLMYSICAVAALISDDASIRSLACEFSNVAGCMIYNSLELPDLTILQSLIVLGHYEIGRGRSSKGWLFCGMAFRLTHEMGLHLDPNNWTSMRYESPIDREILRRVYWAAFIVDKQLSLYFGRPPALYPQEADVDTTIRIPYPPEWESLLDSYISKGTSATAFEDGITVVSFFDRQVELAKIFHSLIVEVFKNRRCRTDPSAAAETAHKVHESMMEWLDTLPQTLRWNQCSVGRVPTYVLQLHMRFHTGMIILHRPPLQHLDEDAVIHSEGVEVCHQSLSAILRLIRSFERYYHLRVLPLDFVHTLSAAAEVVMMKKYMDKSRWEDKDIAKPMEQILKAMETVQDVYPCIKEIHEGILNSIQTQHSDTESQQGYSMEQDLELMDLLQPGGPIPNVLYPNESLGDSLDMHLPLGDEFLDGRFS
ncbi:fungal-specific transcription factor domain-containing protein [Stachybotrys elegans]|uniref:Fungal-specific transcription factor domain-containing protein n=1 Tax=Stachybotrys elegans TaxID=80388 RepID=A0A8K0SZQ2_9HYPO|nr:fungal-specific transcription factor domain-containing protein [Stachybotrys elegans]